MNDLKTFFNGIPKSLWLILVILIIIICFFPILFTLPSFKFDFTETGQIGDTIGGTMGPFIAIVAALLTFIAFWAQFEANRELIKENRRNHFESRFYKMLDIHLENVNDLNSRFKVEEFDSCFHIWCVEIVSLCKNLRSSEHLNDFVSKTRYEYREEPTQQAFLEFLSTIQVSQEEYEKIIFEIAYSYFFSNSFALLKYGDNKKTQMVVEFATLWADYLKEEKIEIKSTPKNELLGRYYRHLYQIVKYVDEQPDELFEEDKWKGGYLSILRSQMSDYEQLLLYYNAQSSNGSAWNENHFIEKYKLIKNIPYFSIAACDGQAPLDKYDEAVKEADKNGEKFFEWY